MNGASILLECLMKEGVDTLFGYPGGSVIPLYDALYDYKHHFTHIRTSHEQGLVHAADGYARSSNKVGVCITTSGPGATNAITGIATAYMDSVPLVIITGQVPCSLLGKDSFQEIDITGMTLSITKHNYLIRDVKDIPKTINEAFKLANEGRKGPVLIDIPKDIFTKEYDFDASTYIVSYDNLESKDINNIEEPRNYKLENYNVNCNCYKNIREAITLIKNSTKPVIYAGGGIKSSNSNNLLKQFAEKIDTPVLNTLMGLSNIDRSHPLSLGMVGMHGSSQSNLALFNSDLVIAIGARFSDRVIGNDKVFKNNKKVIHIDIDSSEISKNIEADIRINKDLNETLSLLIENVDKKDNCLWRKEIDKFKLSEEISSFEFHPLNIIRKFNSKFEDLIVVTDVGQHQMWSAKYFNFKEGNNFITSAGLGTMGFGLGAAIGSKVANPHKTVVLVTGDGSFRMNCNELATLSKYNLNIIILLFNNSSLGMVRQWQKLFSNERYSETDIDNEVNFISLANAYGLNGYSTSSISEFSNIIDNLHLNKSVLIECNINKDYDVYPIVPPNNAIDNLRFN